MMRSDVDTDRMEVGAELVQRMGATNLYEVTATRTEMVVAPTAAEAIAVVVDSIKKSQ